ncbi:hypothetical protein FBU59_000556 [Linderina macrospora]|uniref:Uncharacterized protein n=1 Tax=Linderina macrospora TaxID=4868 RepID=A0ACC1JGI9_9FUNG|nr:hypothetical protein FBU59_000556 [Linderina macrospora]
MSELVDDFYTARNLLYIGAYPQSLSNLSTLTRLSAEAAHERDSLQYRAYLGQGNYQLVLDELSATTQSPLLQAVRQLALQQASQTTNDQAAEAVSGLVESQGGSTSAVFAAVGAQVLANAGQYPEALRLLAGHPRNLECVCVMVTVYLRMNRADLADKLMGRVRGWAEDAPLAQLAEAWTGVQVGGSKVSDAFYVFEELAQGASVTTVRMLNAMAATKMQLGQYPEAGDLLQEASERDPSDPDTLANRLVLAGLTGKGKETRSRLLGQLKAASPNHVVVADLAAKEAEFDKLAAEFSK